MNVLCMDEAVFIFKFGIGRLVEMRLSLWLNELECWEEG